MVLGTGREEDEGFQVSPRVAASRHMTMEYRFCADPCRAEGLPEGESRRRSFMPAMHVRRCVDGQVFLQHSTMVLQRKRRRRQRRRAHDGTGACSGREAWGEVQTSASPMQKVKQQRCGLLSIVPPLWVHDRSIWGRCRLVKTRTMARMCCSSDLGLHYTAAYVCAVRCAGRWSRCPRPTRAATQRRRAAP